MPRRRASRKVRAASARGSSASRPWRSAACGGAATGWRSGAAAPGRRPPRRSRGGCGQRRDLLQHQPLDETGEHRLGHDVGDERLAQQRAEIGDGRMGAVEQTQLQLLIGHRRRGPARPRPPPSAAGRRRSRPRSPTAQTPRQLTAASSRRPGRPAACSSEAAVAAGTIRSTMLLGKRTSSSIQAARLGVDGLGELPRRGPAACGRCSPCCRSTAR